MYGPIDQMSGHVRPCHVGVREVTRGGLVVRREVRLDLLHLDSGPQGPRSIITFVYSLNSRLHHQLES